MHYLPFLFGSWIKFRGIILTSVLKVAGGNLWWKREQWSCHCGGRGGGEVVTGARPTGSPPMSSMFHIPYFCRCFTTLLIAHHRLFSRSSRKKYTAIALTKAIIQVLSKNKILHKRFLDSSQTCHSPVSPHGTICFVKRWLPNANLPGSLEF